jgi:hypothetical protein
MKSCQSERTPHRPRASVTVIVWGMFVGIVAAVFARLESQSGAVLVGIYAAAWYRSVLGTSVLGSCAVAFRSSPRFRQMFPSQSIAERLRVLWVWKSRTPRSRRHRGARSTSTAPLIGPSQSCAQVRCSRGHAPSRQATPRVRPFAPEVGPGNLTLSAGHRCPSYTVNGAAPPWASLASTPQSSSGGSLASSCGQLRATMLRMIISYLFDWRCRSESTETKKP